VGETCGRDRVPGIDRRIAASLVTDAAATGLVVFAHVGAFDDGDDPFPR
jgi:hypothetical protein